jgi:hypothetical protein
MPTRANKGSVSSKIRPLDKAIDSAAGMGDLATLTPTACAVLQFRIGDSLFYPKHSVLEAPTRQPHAKGLANPLDRGA